MISNQPDQLDVLLRLRSQVGALKQLLNVSDQTVIGQADKLERALEELVAARDQAINISEFKSQFLVCMSHEIRTPLSVVMGMLDLLLRGTLDRGQREQAQVAYDFAYSLLEIINDILDFSKIEAGKIELEITEFDLVQLVEGTAELLADQARNKKLALMTFVSPQAPRMVQGDSGRIRQVLFNLLGNAIKFTERGEVILRVKIDETNGNVVFAVSDTGIGMFRNELERLFEPFVQADGTITRRYGGTGLGLSISKRLAALMMGTIGVETDPGVGSTFSFSIPLTQSNKTVASVEPKEDLRATKLLVVSQSGGFVEVIQAYASAWGMRCCLAATGESAIEMLTKAAEGAEPFDLTMVDLMLPDVGGLELSRAIRQRGYLDRTKLILVSSYYVDSGTGAEALKAGFSAVLVRPLKQSSLMDCITRLLTDGGSETLVESEAKLEYQETGSALLGPILVAEDNPASQRMIVLQLKRLGFAAHTVGNGTEAVQAVERFRFALILMDVMMPEVDGLEATRCIRKNEALTGRRVPIVALTAHAMKGDRDKCLAVGMDDYISKPISFDELQRVLNRWAASEQAAAPGLCAGAAGGSAPLPVQSAVDQLVDLSMLRSICTDGELKKMLDAFNTLVPNLLNQLELGVRLHDAKEVQFVAHSLKGSCGAFGASLMASLCQSIEQAVALARWHEVQLLTESLVLTFKRVSQSFITKDLISGD